MDDDFPDWLFAVPIIVIGCILLSQLLTPVAYPVYSIDGKVQNIELNYGSLRGGDYTTVSLENGTVLCFNQLVQNLQIGHSYRFTYEDRANSQGVGGLELKTLMPLD